MRRLFRALLRLFPADVRGDFGSEMEDVFDEELRDAGTRRRRARAWGRTAAGILRIGPRLHAEQTLLDARDAVRHLRRSPVVTAVAVVTLAVGIGSSVSTFSLADAFLFRPLPFAEPDRLVHVWAAERERGYLTLRVSWQEAERWTARTDVFDGVAIFNYTSVELTGGAEPERVQSGSVGTNVFEVLGVAPLRGRAFLPGDGLPGADPVAMLTEGFWRARLDGREDVVGTTIEIAGTAHRVVGVMPAAFVFPLPTTELWTPRIVESTRLTADIQPFQVVARLRDGVSREAAAAALEAGGADLGRAYPALEGRTANVVPLRSALNFADDILSVGFVVVGFANLLVLLTACANISSLMLGRAVRRGREVAIRAAIGASRFRLIRQFLVESLVLAVIGAAGGVLVAAWSLAVATRAIPADLYRVGDLAFDWRALAVTAALACGSALVFGLTPALRFARVDLGAAMRQDGGAGTTSRRSLRLQSLLVQNQVGFSVVLLVGTVLVGRSVTALGGVDPGFEPEGVLAAQVVLPSTRYPDADAVAAFHRDVRARVAAAPGVRAATTVNYLPLNHETSVTRVRVPGRARPDGREPPDATVLTTGPDYFAVLGIPLLQGRDFVADDGRAQAPVAIVNRSLAARHWPDVSPIGASLQLDDADPPVTVIGVVGDSRQVDLSEDQHDQVFLPQAQDPWRYARVLARTDGDPATIAGGVTTAIHAVDPLLPVVEVRTMEQVVADALLPYRALSLSLVAMGGFALALALLGIYGIVMVYVADRTRELGVRVALGADRARIVGFVLGRGLRLATVGATAGLVVAWLAFRAVGGLLYGVGAGDPVTYLFVVALVLGVTLAAGLAPARRAARVSPLLAIKAD